MKAPDGWHEVTSGKVRKGDQTWLFNRQTFETVDRFQVGRPVEKYLCIIRQDKEGRDD